MIIKIIVCAMHYVTVKNHIEKNGISFKKIVKSKDVVFSICSSRNCFFSTRHYGTEPSEIDCFEVDEREWGQKLLQNIEQVFKDVLKRKSTAVNKIELEIREKKKRIQYLYEMADETRSSDLCEDVNKEVKVLQFDIKKLECILEVKSELIP